jgi:Tfp pilus assembly protein PilF
MKNGPQIEGKKERMMRRAVLLGLFLGASLSSGAGGQQLPPFMKPEPTGPMDYTESPVKASIAGYVRIAGGAKLEGAAEVRLETTTGLMLYQSTAGKNGNFHFSNIPCGFYVLAVDVAGYQPVRMPLEHSFIPAEGIFLYLQPADGTEAAAVRASAAAGVEVPDKARKEFVRGMERLARNDPEKSIVHLQKAVEMCPAFDDATTQLALVYLQKKNYAEAQRVLEKATAANDKNARAFALLGRTYREQRMYQKAVLTLTRAIELKESSWMARLELGEAYSGLGQFAQALPHMARAHELNPGIPAIHQRYYNTLVRTNQLRPALAELDEFLKLFPDHALAPRARQQREALAKAVGAAGAAVAAKDE